MEGGIPGNLNFLKYFSEVFKLILWTLKNFYKQRNMLYGPHAYPKAFVMF